MKIGDLSRPFVEQLGLREEKQVGDMERPAFQEMLLRNSQRLQKEELDSLLRNIDEIGRELAKRCTWRTLMNYKERIRKFLDTVVKGGFQTKEQRGFDRFGRMKIYKLVSQIDQLMGELAEEVLHDEKDHLKILSLIGDIRGLLLDLYF